MFNLTCKVFHLLFQTQEDTRDSIFPKIDDTITNALFAMQWLLYPSEMTLINNNNNRFSARSNCQRGNRKIVEAEMGNLLLLDSVIKIFSNAHYWVMPNTQLIK